MIPKLKKLQFNSPHSHNINCISIGPRSGRVFATGDDDGLLDLFYIAKDSPILSFGPYNSPIQHCIFDFSEDLILFTTLNGIISLINLDIVQTLFQWNIHGHGTAICFHPQYSDIFCVGDSNGLVTLYTHTSSIPLQVYNAHREAVTAVSISQNGSMLATAGNDKTVKLFDITTGASLSIFRSTVGTPRMLSFNPVEKTLVVASDNTKLRIFDLDKMYETKSGYLRIAEPLAVSHTRDGSLIVSASAALLTIMKSHAVDITEFIQLNLAGISDMAVFETGIEVATFDKGQIELTFTEFPSFKKSFSQEKITPKRLDLGIAQESPPKIVRRKTEKRLPQVEKSIFQDFQVERTEFVERLSDRRLKLSAAKEKMKRFGVDGAMKRATENASDTVDLLVLMVGYPEAYHQGNLDVAMRLIEACFSEGQTLCVLAMSDILESIGPPLLVAKGVDAPAPLSDDIVDALKLIKRLLGDASQANGAQGELAKQLLKKWEQILS